MMIIIPGNSNMGVEVGSVGSEASINFLLFFSEKGKILQTDRCGIKSDLCLGLSYVRMLS